MEGVQVVVDAASPLGRRGWIGILVIGTTVTASVPRADLERPVAEALAGLTGTDATNPDVVVPRLPPTRAMIGPAALFYPPHGFSVPELAGVDEVTRSEVEAWLEAASQDDLEESGVDELSGTVFGSRTASGELGAVCGYRHWPNDVAHLSVLASPRHRRQGHGQRAALAAIKRAMEEELLPQWRARPLASQALARSIGLIQVGAQLGLEPA